MMKRIRALLLALIMLFALFAGCSKPETGTQSTPTDKPTTTATAAPTAAPTQTAKPEETAEPAGGKVVLPDGTFYNFAAGDYEKDANGIPKAKYEYELPLTNSDEVLTFWTTCYTPNYITMDYPDSPFPIELERQTGVNIEYMIVSSDARATNFATLLAADDLPDITTQASSFYPGSFVDAIENEKYFVNIYDYKDYCPNYIYEVARNPEDESLQQTVYLKENLIPAFYCIRDKTYVQNTLFVRSDWLDRIGWARDEIVTWEDTYDLLKAFQSQIETAVHPTVIFQSLATQHWACFDTFAYINPYAMQWHIDENGKAWLAQTTQRDYNVAYELNRFDREGLFQDDWQTWIDYNNPNWRAQWLGDSYGYVVLATSDCSTERQILDTEDAEWLPIPDPVVTPGQTLHVGAALTRTYYGSINVSTNCDNIELAMTWLDWRYSDAGADLMSWGVKGHAWDYNEDGEREVLKSMYADSEKNYTMMLLIYCLNTFSEGGLDINEVHYAFPDGKRVIEAYDYLRGISNNDLAFMVPRGVVLTSDQSSEVQRYSNDIRTFIAENFLSFVDGSKPLSEWDAYVETLNQIGVPEVLAVYQEAYDDYIARTA